MASFLVFLLLAATAVADVCPGSKLKPEDRDLLLNFHNEFRSKVALGKHTGGGVPVAAAADMMKMEWDCELEKSAQEWTESLDQCQSKHSRAGHTTQMAWGSSYRLGCGITVCEKPEDFWAFPKILVCRYADQGNIVGQPIYTDGPAASKCPEGWQLFMASSLVFLLLLAAGAASAADWCPEGTSKFSQADREFILNAHNSLRSRIALGRMTANGKSVPQAANMEKMVEWDCDLEQESQKWSESTGCAMTHSPTSASYGENIYRNSADKPTKYTTSVGAEDAITRWENEYNTCEFTSNVFLSIAEHPSSNKLGCGVMTGVECGKDQFGRYPTFIVCRYSPRGNWKHSEIYKAGSACSQCPEETNCESETGLCVKEGAAPLITTTTVVHSETTTAKASAGENTTEDPELGHNICPEI
uniref:Uncharacterized protein n=1 Tax=Pristionchus pacificus TaxID=54126 RepID=A0A2A6CS55_PRIPA|eukprot:PDM80873.1 hypothetical protein PRIPAC_35876 [Pristionchus pacificus]